MLGTDARVPKYKDDSLASGRYASQLHLLNDRVVEGSMQTQKSSEKMHHLIKVGIREFGTRELAASKASSHRFVMKYLIICHFDQREDVFCSELKAMTAQRKYASLPLSNTSLRPPVYNQHGETRTA